MLSFECIKNEKSVYFLLTSATGIDIVWTWGRILDSGNHIGHNFEKPDTEMYGGCTGKGNADQCT